MAYAASGQGEAQTPVPGAWPHSTQRMQREPANLGSVSHSASLVQSESQGPRPMEQKGFPARSRKQAQSRGRLGDPPPQKTSGRAQESAPAGQARGASVTHPGWVQVLPGGQQGSKWPAGQTSSSGKHADAWHDPFTQRLIPQQSQSSTHEPDSRQQRKTSPPLQVTLAQIWPSQH